MKYIFVDPSGSFNEGKGHTGIAVIEDNDWKSLKYQSIAAKDYLTRYDYWCAIIDYIFDCADVFDETKVIIESFMIRTQGFLMGKMPETIQFIGALEFTLEMLGIKYALQTPTQAKSRFKDDDLPRYIPGFEKRINGRYYLNGKQVNDHIRDALKHLLYFMKYRKE
jgi:hypothetical protein